MRVAKCDEPRSISLRGSSLGARADRVSVPGSALRESAAAPAGRTLLPAPPFTALATATLAATAEAVTVLGALLLVLLQLRHVLVERRALVGRQDVADRGRTA